MGETVLIPNGDHSYREAYVTRAKVVWNTCTRSWSEYVGDEYLDENESVYEKKVAE